MNCDELRHLIVTAFHGVDLDGGMSLRQAEICDKFGKDSDGRVVSDMDFAAIPDREITDNWSALSLDELERFPYLAHLDPEGFRYYIPAFLLSLLKDANRLSMRVISTLSSIQPTRDTWLYHMRLYEALTDAQRTAIAAFVFHLQSYPKLTASDQRQVSAALQLYWRQFLPELHEPNASDGPFST